MIDIDGYEAVILFYMWQSGDAEAKRKLVKYCQTDTLATYLVSLKILIEKNIYIEPVDEREFFKNFL